MRNKFLALAFAVMMLISLCACGGQTDSTPNNASSVSTGTPSNSNGDLIGGGAIDPLTGLPQSEDASNPDAQDTANQEPSGATEQDTQQSAATSGELSGLVILTVNCDNSKMGRWVYNCDISCLNIETGEQTQISHFLFGDISSEKTYLLASGVKSLTVGDDAARKNWFSPDYQLLAATRISADDGTYQIGWIKDEKFYDITEKLGLAPKNDFETPPRYMAAGFTEDGMYTFYKLSPDALERTYYYVPLDNLSPEYIQEGMIIPEQQPISIGRHARATDHISDSLYVVNTEDQISRIYSSETGELADYVPGDNRFSWNGVVSPDGTEIAFMSRTKTGLEVELFTMPLSGNGGASGDGAPTKIPTPSGCVFMIQEESDAGRSMAYDVRSMLIDWR